MHSIQKIIPKKRQKILDSNHWTEITSILRLLTETDPNRKQTSAYLSLFLKAAAVTNWVRVLSFFDWLTQQIQTKVKTKEFLIQILSKFRLTKLKTGSKFLGAKIYSVKLPSYTKSCSFGAKRKPETREIAAVQILIQF